MASTAEALTKCQDPSANGAGAFCDDPLCPCTLGEGDCDLNSQCVAPYLCVGKASYFGLAGGNICAGPYCNNKRKDFGETAVDCGGSCGTIGCPADVCVGLAANGLVGHCSTTCPCPATEGHCASSNECWTGLVCASKKGPAFGFGANINVCVGAHCSNGVLDGDEVGADCGGSCAPCGGGASANFRVGGATNDVAMDFTYDSTGNIIVAGRFSGTVNFGGGALTSAGSSDIFLAKYSASGAHMWSKRFGSTGADGDAAVSVAVDRYDVVYLAGNIYGSVDFGGGPRTSAGALSSAFIARFNATGGHLFSKAYGGARGNKIEKIRVNPATSVIYVVGAFQESINLGGANLVSANAGETTNEWDIFVARLTGSGAHVWSRAIGAAGEDQGTSIAVDTAGDAYVSGFFSETVDFGLGAVTSAGSVDAFAMKLNGASGATQWVNYWGGDSDDRANAVAVGNNLNAVFAGYVKRPTSFDGGTTTLTPAGGTDGFVVSLTTAGAHQWSRLIGGTSNDTISAAAVLPATNEIILGGYFSGTINPGGGNVTSAGGRDILGVKLTSTGAFSWQLAHGGTGADLAYGVGISSQNVGITGAFQGTASFGTGNLVSAGGDDIFVASYRL